MFARFSFASTGKCNSMQWSNYLPQRAKVLAQRSNLTPQRAKNIANQRANITQWSNYLPQRAEILSHRSQRVNSTSKEYWESTGKYTPNANMADHSVVARDELHESEVSQSFMFDNASPEKSYFIVDLFCFISLCLRIAVFLIATRKDRNLPPFTSKGK